MENMKRDILKRDENIFVILTPSCDFVKRPGKGRKVEFVLLCEAIKFVDIDEHKKYIDSKSKFENADKKITPEELEKIKKSFEKSRNELKILIEDRKGDRYFFLPG